MKERRKAKDRPYVAPLVVAAIAASAFLPTLSFDFTYDDHNHFVRNAFVQNPENFSELLPWRYFRHEFPDQGRPLLVLSEMLDRALGASAGVCHLQSTLWHAVVAALVFALAVRLGASRGAAALAGILFGLHPLNVEAVAGISNREDVMVAGLGLGALLVARRALGGRIWPLIGLTALYAAALAAKESAIAIPGLLALLAVCSPYFRPGANAHRIWIRIALALALVTAGWAGFQYRLGYPSLIPGTGGTGLEQALHAPTAVPALRAITGFQSHDAPPSTPTPPPASRRPYGEMYGRDAVPIEAFRAWQIIVPWPSSPEYDVTPFRARYAFLLGAGGLIALALAAFRDFRKSRRVTLAVGWFFVTTLPVLLPSFILNPLADRYLYFATAGFTIVLARFVFERLPALLHRPNAGSWGGFVIGMIYFVLASADIAAWKDDIALFEKAKGFAPGSARVHHNLGSALARADRAEEAERELLSAVEIDPTLTAAHYNLGLLAEKRSDRKRAIVHYQATLDSRPVVAERALVDRACMRLGTLLIRDGRSNEAASMLARENVRDPASQCSSTLRRMLARGSGARGR